MVRKYGGFLLLIFASVIASSIIDVINVIIFREEGKRKQNTFSPIISVMQGSFYRAVIAIMTLPDKAYTSLSAISKSIYRMVISKKHLLEWTTSEEAEKKAKNDLPSYYKEMLANIILAIAMIIYVIFNHMDVECIFLFLIAVMWTICPFVMWKISKKSEEKNLFESLSTENKEYVLEIARRTWNFFKDTISSKTNYLPPDNYQEDRKEVLAMRTSSTNIGLRIISSYICIRFRIRKFRKHIRFTWQNVRQHRIAFKMEWAFI